MNAYKLADKLIDDYASKYFYNDSNTCIVEAAGMLRQQAYKITELEKENAFLRDWRDTWLPYVNQIKQSEERESDKYATGYWNGIAYKRQRELTDEEIVQEWVKLYPDVFHTHLIDFARAILRKASEK
jgi:hypothetical protein